MDVLAIFGLQFFMSLVVWSLIAKWLLTPWLETKSPHQALFFLTLPHAFRYVGMVFLVPGVVSQTMPASFAIFAAYGDLVTGMLALLALIALRTGWAGALPLVWLFNIVGTVDLLNALRQENAVAHFEAAWYIPTFLVPVLLVTHFMMFARLLRRAKKSDT